jgi:hypothetical protein
MTYTDITYTHEEILAHRKEWVAALRSGEYPQAQSVLYDGYAYCCLGVACTLAGLEAEEDGTNYWFEGDHLTLPSTGREWLGTKSQNPVLDIDADLRENVQGPRPGVDDEAWGWPADVASLNDQGFTFNQIADLIEYFGFEPTEDLIRP